MKTYIELLKKDLAEHTPRFESAMTLMDSIHWHYTEFNPIDRDERVQESLNNLHVALKHLPAKEYETVFDIAAELCFQQERAAFQEGFRLALHLLTELDG